MAQLIFYFIFTSLNKLDTLDKSKINCMLSVLNYNLDCNSLCLNIVFNILIKGNLSQRYKRITAHIAGYKILDQFLVARVFWLNPKQFDYPAFYVILFSQFLKYKKFLLTVY